MELPVKTEDIETQALAYDAQIEALIKQVQALSGAAQGLRAFSKKIQGEKAKADAAAASEAPTTDVGIPAPAADTAAAPPAIEQTIQAVAPSIPIAKAATPAATSLAHKASANGIMHRVGEAIKSHL